MPSSSKQFTVLGAGGYIGSALTASLRAKGIDVYAPARGELDLFGQDLGHVIYCIGLTADFRSRPYDTVRAHVGVLADVLEHGRFQSLLYLSSTRVYGNADSGIETSAVRVNPADPSDLYNLSKLTGESLCKSCGRDNVRIARLSNVIGSDPRSDNFLFSLVREALSGRIELQTHPSSAKDYVLLDDVVALLPRIAVAGQYDVYNIASGSSLSHETIACKLGMLTGCEVSIRANAQRQDFPTIDIRRIQGEFGFSPSPVLDALPHLVHECRTWYSEQQANPSKQDNNHESNRTV